MHQKGSPSASAPPQKTLPEQLKVFKGDDVSGYKPTSPKNRRMLYSGSAHNSSSRPSFPGNFFPLESSPRHQRRAVNISEPFAVSVPLRVSAVISSNSTPCRGHAKDKAATLKPCKETSELGSNSGKSNTFPQLEPKKQEGLEKNKEELTPTVLPEGEDIAILKWLVTLCIKFTNVQKDVMKNICCLLRYKQRSGVRRSRRNEYF